MRFISDEEIARVRAETLAGLRAEYPEEAWEEISGGLADEE